MSLKAFHLFFILVSIVLAAGFGAWSLREAREAGEGVYYFFSVGSFLAALALSFYVPWFLRKLRNVSYLVLAAGLVFSQTASACPTCISDNKSVMAQSAGSAVFFLLCIVSMVLVGFASLFLSWAYRSRQLRKAGVSI